MHLEQSSAFVLVTIGLLGFLVDFLVRPISSAGLVLLLLAATPSLVATFRRQRAATSAEAAQESEARGSDEAPAERPIPSGGLAARPLMERPRAEMPRPVDSGRPAPERAPGARTRADHMEPEGRVTERPGRALAREIGEIRPLAPPAPTRTPPPRPRDDARAAGSAPPSGQIQRQPEPVGQRGEVQAAPARRPAEPVGHARNDPHAAPRPDPRRDGSRAGPRLGPGTGS